MDADVISIETSRSKMELLDAFKTYAYPNEIGPGIHDIRSRTGSRGNDRLTQVRAPVARR